MAWFLRGLDLAEQTPERHEQGTKTMTGVDLPDRQASLARVHFSS